MNDIVVKYLRKLHDAWLKKQYKYALFEANYLIDYYCSLIIAINTKDQPAFIESPTKKQIKNRKREWASTSIPQDYEVLIKNISYKDGFKQSKELLKELVAGVLKARIYSKYHRLLYFDKCIR
jgi:hypothetical protein